MKINLLCTLPLCGILVFGCQFKKDTDEKNSSGNSDTGPKIEKISSDQFQISVEPQPEPNKYQVHFRWKAEFGAFEIRANNSRLFFTKGKSKEFVHAVTGGDTLQYLVNQLGGEGDTVESFQADLQIPKDYAVFSAVDLTEDLKFNGGRFFLANHSQISTNTHSIEIVAEEFISDGGVIESFPKGTTASRESSGRSAGKVSITSKRSTGKLAVRMRGENGGAGLDGCHRSFFSCAGTDGGNGGDAGYFQFISESSPGFEITTINEPGKAGPGGDTTYDCDDHSQVKMPPCEDRGPKGSPTSFGHSGKEGLGPNRVCYRLQAGTDYVCK